MSADALYDLDAEVAVIGSVFINPDVADDVLEVLDPADFQSDRYGVVLAAIKACADASVAVNPVNIVAALNEAGTLARAGGVAHVSTLDTYVPASGNWRSYARIVRDYAVRRRLIAAATQAISDARDTTRKVTDVIASAEAAIQLVGERTGVRKPVLFREAMYAEWKELEALNQRGTSMTGISSGIAELDRMTAGFQRSHMIVVAGRPGSGKSAAAFGFAVQAAMALKPEDGAVACFSLEMSQSEILRRILSSQAKVDGGRFRDGQFAHADWAKMANTTNSLVNIPLWLDSREALTLHDIRSECRRIRTKSGRVAMVVIDYLQIMRGDPDAENRTQEVSQLAVGAKRLAKEFDCPVIALSQLNRGLESRSDKRPIMADLRESGAIEQEADLVMFVYRDEMYDANSADAGTAEFIIGKQRGGPTGTVRVAFEKSYTLFRDMPDRSRS